MVAERTTEAVGNSVDARPPQALPPSQAKGFGERILSLEEDCRVKFEQSVQSQQEIVGLLAKTNSEVDKLSTRELQFANRLRDAAMHLDNDGREEIRDIYTGAHDLQMRLFVMRSQAEQLQARQQHLAEYQEKFRLIIDLVGVIPITDGDGEPNGSPGWTRSFGRSASGPAGEGEIGTPVSGPPSILSLIEAQEEERLHVSHQIHDDPTQTLANLMLRAEIRERLVECDVTEARAELRGLKSVVNASLKTRSGGGPSPCWPRPRAGHRARREQTGSRSTGLFRHPRARAPAEAVEAGADDCAATSSTPPDGSDLDVSPIRNRAILCAARPGFAVLPRRRGSVGRSIPPAARGER